jgi:hypothetical protein
LRHADTPLDEINTEGSESRVIDARNDGYTLSGCSTLPQGNIALLTEKTQQREIQFDFVFAAVPNGSGPQKMVLESVVVEQILDSFVTVRPEQRQHQQDPGLLRVEFIGCHQIHRIVVYFHIASDGPGCNPAAPNDDDTLLRGVRGCLQGCLIHIAIADSSDDDAFL